MKSSAWGPFAWVVVLSALVGGRLFSSLLSPGSALLTGAMIGLIIVHTVLLSVVIAEERRRE